MQTYRASSLTSMTPETETTKLAAALEEVAGVSSVALRADSSEIEIKSQGDSKPKREEIIAAASSAGFTISARKK